MVIPGAHTEARQSEELHAVPVAAAPTDPAVGRQAEGDSQEPQEVLLAVREQGPFAYDARIQGADREACQAARAVHRVPIEARQGVGGPEEASHAVAKQYVPFEGHFPSMQSSV